MDLNLSYKQSGSQLSFLVRKFVFLKSGEVNKVYLDKHIPDGACTLIFNFKGALEISVDHQKFIKLPTYFLALPHFSFVNIKVKTPCDSFCVSCNASTFSRIFHLSLDKKEIPSFKNIADIIPESLYFSMAEESNNLERVKIFEKYVAENFASAVCYRRDRIDEVYEVICNSNGLVNINALADGVKISTRSLRRNFLKRVGVTPKALCRIVRANFVLAALKNSSTIDFQDIVYSGNYFDQSHLVNDFKKIIGESPGMFIKRDIRLLERMSGR